jgi:DNA helicase-2/ATP-dependent DNA helicase PcrA
MVLDHSQLIEHYQAEREGADRVENLQELVNAAESFVTQEGFGKDAVALPVDEAMQSQADFAAAQAAQGGATANEETGETLSPLAAFLTHAALESGDNQAQAGQDAVQLMTVHAAKGLEFDCVFITGLEEGLFPHENSLSEADGKEEERRLMYVALTRARRRLYLSYAQSRMLHGQTRYNIVSSFMREIPEELLKPVNRARLFGASSPRAAYSTAHSTNYASSMSQAGGRGKPEIVREAGIADASSPWRVGQNVTHPKFGAGVIINAEGRGADARVQVNFHRNGTKWLALEFAKLEPA